MYTGNMEISSKENLEKYRIMIVEDEPDIAEGLKYLIERMGYSYFVTGIFYNGQDGVNQVVQQKPDIIITDIRMPGMDGLEMIQKIQNVMQNCNFIVLSGYADFAYAREALRLGVQDYLTKPVDEEELYRVLRQTCEKIKKRKERENRLECLEGNVKRYSEDISKFRIRDLLLLSNRPEDRLEREMEAVGIDSNGDQYVCLLLEEKETIWTEEICKQVESELKKKSKIKVCIAVLMNDKKIAAFVGFDVRETDKILQQMTSILSDFLHSASCGIGRIYQKTGQLGRSYEEAQCALNYKLVNGLGSVILYEEINKIPDKTVRMSSNDMRELELAIAAMDKVNCEKIIRRMFQKIAESEKMSIKDLQIFTVSLILCGIRQMPSLQYQLNEFLGRNILSLENVSKFQSIEQMQNWIINVLFGMFDLKLKEKMLEKKDVIEEIREYITKNFDKEISLKDISERFFINPSYFSQAFKKKTGETYQNYVTNLRIARAKKLLEETDLKVYEVSEMVGYPDTKHFSRVFEKVAGMKPTEYKKR